MLLPRHPSPAAAILLILLIALVCALTQTVNCQLVDGWFWGKESVFRIYRTERMNIAPIGIPAYTYLLQDWIFSFLGIGDMKSLLYGATFLHHTLLASAAIGIAMLGPELRARNGLSVAAVAFLMVIEATRVAQSTMSENFYIPLNVWGIYAIIRCYNRLHRNGAHRHFSVIGWAAVGGMLCGFSAGIKPTLIVLVAGGAGLFLIAARFSLRRCWRPVLALTSAFALVLVWLMGCNLIRFGRFELTNSTAMHLWNVTILDSESILAGQEGYEQLRTAFSPTELEKLKHWQLRREMSRSENPELARFAETDTRFNDFLRDMVIPGIRRHPMALLRVGTNQFFETIFDPPAVVFGPWRKHGVNKAILNSKRLNPLGRTTWLPSVIGRTDVIDRTLDIVLRGFQLGVPYFMVSIAIGIALLVPLRSKTLRCRLRQQTGCLAAVRTARLVPVYGYISVCFLLNRYIVCHVEAMIPRYTLLLLSLLFIAAGSLVPMCIGLLRGCWTRSLRHRR